MVFSYLLNVTNKGIVCFVVSMVHEYDVEREDSFSYVNGEGSAVFFGHDLHAQCSVSMGKGILLPCQRKPVLHPDFPVERVFDMEDNHVLMAFDGEADVSFLFIQPQDCLDGIVDGVSEEGIDVCRLHEGEKLSVDDIGQSYGMFVAIGELFGTDAVGAISLLTGSI